MSLLSQFRRRGWLVAYSLLLIAFVLSCVARSFSPLTNSIRVVLFFGVLGFTIALWRLLTAAREELLGMQKEVAELQRLIDLSRDAIIGVNTEGIITSWNNAARIVYGYSAKEAIGLNLSLVFDHSAAEEAAILLARVSKGEIISRHETTHLKKGRTRLEVSLSISPVREGFGGITGASVVVRDITETKRAAESLAQQMAAIRASMDGMAIIDHLGGCIYLNDAYPKTFGYKDPQSLIGASWEMFFSDDELDRLKDEVMPVVWRDGSWRGEAMGKRLSGETLPLEISISSVAGGGLVQVVRDITERKRLEETLRNSSLKDELTGLYNRRGLLKQAAPFFDCARRQNEKLLLLFIDLDGMKRINDEFGHSEGDTAIISTARILNRSFRGSDVIARLGGDEFTVVVTDPSANKDQAVARITENLRQYNDQETRGYKLSFSIGVASLEPERLTCFEELLEEADQAMYEQKRRKKRRATERTQKQMQADRNLVETPEVSGNCIPFALSSSEGSGSEGTFDQAAIGMAVVSADGTWLQVNEALCNLVGYSEQELRATTFQRLTHSDDLIIVQSYLQRVLGGYIQGHQQEMRYIHQQGHTVWVLWHVTLFKDSQAETKKLFFQVQDITDRKTAEERLTQDHLTGLPNRARFNDLLKMRVARLQKNRETECAVLFLDVDRFKLVNDSLGPASGDQLLSQMAQRIKLCMRQGDILGRVGGDEFAVLLDDVSEEEEACSVASRIQQALAISFNLFGQEVYTTLSIGIATSATYGEQGSDMLRNAETAMHRAKSLGKARYEVFGRDMQGESISRLKMETDLRHACERDELFIQYQPIVSLRDCSLIGFEALARWRHPEYGLVPPNHFIPVAEETGQILSIGEMILKAACNQARLWQERHQLEQPLFVSVNLSVKQFNQPGLVDNIATLLAETKLAPHCLKLEITESVFSENVDATVKLLTQLRNLGVRLSIDDFGTGYSSLSYLQHFPIDTLKIDRSFVSQMMEKDENIQIVRTIVSLGQNLGMDVIAEGVETEDQLTLLRQLDCENGQGFLFSKGLEPSEVEKFIVDFSLSTAMPLGADAAVESLQTLVA
jgi:diguanylate cyclase (GGDEF)-like protein/PAS domain S-box-containing protein